MLMDLYLNGIIDMGDYMWVEEELLREAWNLVFRYAAQWEDDWTIMAVEEQFEVTLDNGEILTLTPDLIVEDSAGAVWVVDHKTTDRMPAAAQTGDESLQALTYMSMLKPLIPNLRGFVFNYLRKKAPTEPRLTKTGDKRVADLARIDTDYETLLLFLEENAPDLLDDPVHKQRLAELKETDKFFVRHYVYTSDEMLASTIEDIETTVQHIHLSEETDRWHRVFLPYAGPQSCTRCPFKELCVAEMRGYNVEPLLDALYEPRDLSHKEYDYRTEEL
jgi:hypothetical protein